MVLLSFSLRRYKNKSASSMKPDALKCVNQNADAVMPFRTNQ